MSISANEHLLEQASAIFLKLQEAPEDVGLLTERDAFLAGGEAHREAYFFIAKAYAATSPRRRGKILPTIVVFLVLSLGAYLAGPAAYTYWISDFRTAGSPKEFVLASGDRAHLDATSALSDRTAEGDRNVELIRGAAYFSVNQNARPFTVAIGGLEAKALGTEFEAAWIDEVVSLAVFEGVVEIRGPTGIWTLNAGDRLTWSDVGIASIEQIDLVDVASWRDDRLNAIQMTFAQVADIIDRRLSGTILILDEQLAGSKVTGSYDLSKAESALRILVASKRGKVIAAQPLGAVVYSSR